MTTFMEKAAEILAKVHRIELRARRMAAESFAGQYKSGFKGQGLDFEDFREYAVGDDPRFIDWKVTARMGTPFVRRFLEEREQSLILAIDTSASMRYASAKGQHSKLEYVAEVAAVLAFSAAMNSDKCGLLLYGQDTRFYLPPAKGVRQTLRIIREIIDSKPAGKDTPMSTVADYLLGTQKKTAMVVLMSDFLQEVDKPALGRISFKHEVIPIRIEDPLSLQLPDAGRIIATNPETQQSYYANLSTPEIRYQHEMAVAQHRKAWNDTFNSLGLDHLDLLTSEPFLVHLRALFSRRSRFVSR